ncbi:MAG: GIY-YIG nuclease family protein [Caldilineaceae bacterium]
MQTALILFLGAAGTQGIYLLRIHVPTSIVVTFGRFGGGRPIPVLPGDYLYIGSALGQRGATSLAGRLLRHTTRSGNLPPHAIRTPLWAQLQEVGLIPHNRKTLPNTKRCFWHIDYLVDQLTAEITQIIALRTPHRLEARVARTVAADPALSPLAPGLGASDDPRATHLLRVDAPESWWQRLPARLMEYRNEQPK